MQLSVNGINTQLSDIITKGDCLEMSVLIIFLFLIS
jgi:hypothetical protein